MRQRLRLMSAGAATALALVFLCSADTKPSAQAQAAPGTGPARADADIQLQLGNLLVSDGRYQEAADAFRRALADAPPRVAIAANAGLVTSLLRVGDFQSAFTNAESSAREYPASADTQSVYGDALWAIGRFEESERALRDALAIEPGLPRAHHGMARVFAARSRFGEAIAEVQAALKASPSDREYQYTLASIHTRTREFAAAAAAFENYVNLLPNRDKSEKAAWARAQVRFLRSFEGRQPLAVVSDQKVHVVPFRIVRDKVVVKARVNGSDYRDFMLDTGAEMTIVSRPFAQRTGVRPVTYVRSAGVGEVGLRGLQVGTIDTLQIGSMTITNVPCLIKNPPLQGMPTREAEAFSPLVLGMSMTIDYRLRLLTFGDSLPRVSGGLELPLWLHRLAMVEGTINGSLRANFVVDTGGEVISISQSTAGFLGSPPGRRIALRVYGTSGWDRDAFLMPNVDLAFQDLLMPRTAVVVLNLQAPSALLGLQLGGIVGHQFLSKYTVTIDLQRSTLSLSD
jgi:Flp pilus assembly protein TadD/predicted aspartyl protease